MNKDVPKSDFEIGKIAALDTIKSDILRWMLALAAIAGLVGIVGVREYVKTAVDSAVRSQLSSLSGRIEKASTDAEESTAKARIETRQLDSTIDELGGRATDLSKSIGAVGAEKDRLLTAAQQLKVQQQEMVKATDDLEEKREQLAKIIETENLTTLFAKMRSDFYRVRTLEARVECFASSGQFSKEVPEFFPFAQMSLVRTAKPNSPEQLVAQLHVVNDQNPTAMQQPGAAGASSVIYDYALFEPFQRSLEGKPMRVLDGVDRILLQY
ncbi:MAG: hypothetical protein WB952_00780 [Terriglobales bacterium]